MESALQDVRELIEYPLTHPEIYSHLGVDAPRGILLHGPPGCGKTMLANAIAGELGVPFFKLSAPEIVSGMSGESEAKIRALFTESIVSPIKNSRSSWFLRSFFLLNPPFAVRNKLRV